MYNSTFLPHKPLTSIINDGCDLRTALYRTVKAFDPHGGHNKKSYLLDCMYSTILTEEQALFFKTTKTHNLTGYVLTKKFDIILYEPPKNKTFFESTSESSKIFYDLLLDDGVVIVKTNDFKERGKDKLRGSYDIENAFSSNNFYLFNQIIYIPQRQRDFETDEISSIHYYLMVFKRNT